MMSKQKQCIVFLISISLLFVIAGCANSPVSASNDTEPANQIAQAAASATVAVEEPTAVSIIAQATDSCVPCTTVIVVTATAVPATPTAMLEPTNTPMPQPTATPIPPATPVPAVPPPAWLSYFNLFRDMADLPPVSEKTALTLGSAWHSRYMVVNDDPIAHSEDPHNPLYDEAGHQAGKNGNTFSTSQLDANYIWSTNFWVSAPFHLVPMLHPGLNTIGYGDYIEDAGDVNMAAVLDVRTDREYFPDGVKYPIYFPKNGASTWVVRLSLYEWPNPYGACPGYGSPSGAPIVLQLGDGSITPNVTSHKLAMGDKPLESCVFDETSYRNSNAYAQDLGRAILDLQDAIVILPKKPLAADQTYTVQIVVNGETYTWSFSTRKRPPES